MKYLAIFCLLLNGAFLNAQIIDASPPFYIDSIKLEMLDKPYLSVKALPYKLLSGQLAMVIDFGQHSISRIIGGSYLLDRNSEKVKFHSKMGMFNLLAEMGYEYGETEINGDMADIVQTYIFRKIKKN
jgi:hypothetical protein